MGRLIGKFSTFVAIFLVMLFVLNPFLAMKAAAQQLSQTYLFTERMKTSTSTGMILLVTPTTTFNSGTDDRFVRIFFPAGGDWCQVDATTMTVAGVAASAVDLGIWDIDAALPGTLTGICYQGGTGSDYIEIAGATALTAGVSYGVSISSHANFRTGTSVGNNVVSVEIREGTKSESVTFGINLLANDQVVVSATVSAANTITCTLSTNAVNLGTLYRGGVYITGGHNFTTDSSSGFYWAVYGTGDGSTAAGLYKVSETQDLLSSTGSGGLVNLLTGEGFGLILSSAVGTVSTNYQGGTAGIFGSIGRTFSNANLILSHTAGTTGAQSSSVTFGARAGGSAQVGSYQETLTYVCGAYVTGS